MLCAFEKIIIAEVCGHIQLPISYKCRIPHLQYLYRISRNVYISNTKVPMVTKLGRVVTYVEELRAIKSHDLLRTWSWKIAEQTKVIMSPLPQGL